MKTIVFIKESFINKLASSVNTIEEAKKLFEEKFPEGTYYNFINRTEHLEETCNALNSDNYKMIFVSGFQGTGKTEFVNTLIAAKEENILDFYYECSSVTHLDNIILSLFNYLKKMSVKNSDYKRNFKISNTQSIDERLINSIKNLERPLLIAIDGFENLLNDTSSEEYKELIHFLEFTSSLPQIKIIVSGRRIDFSSFKKREKFFEIKLGALEEQKAYQILRNNDIQETESGLKQIFQVTRGYPENLLWFSNAVKSLEIVPFELMQQYYEQETKGFEEFIYQKIYRSIEPEYLKIISFFATIRHSVNIEMLEKLNFADNISEKVNYLLSKMVLTQNRDNFYIKSLLKNTIYTNISLDEKRQVHRYLYELYSEQISKKLGERVFDVSRKLLYSEQYYHYMCLINFGDKSLSDIKTATLSNLKPDFKYLYANISDSLFTGSEETSSQVTEEIIESKPEKNSEKILYPEFYNISDFKIELSPEEKELLNEDIIEDPKIISLDEKREAKNKNLSELELKAEKLKEEGISFYETRKFDIAIQKFKESLILYESLKDKQNIYFVLTSLANACNESFRHDVALMYYHRILNSEDNEINPEYSLAAYVGAADIYNYRQDFDNALKFYRKALSEAEKHSNIKQKAGICFKKALVHDDLGNFDTALEFYLENTKISDSIEINPDIAAAYANIAAIYEERGELNKAKDYYSRSFNFDNLMNNREGQYETLSHIGNICFEQVDYPNANEYFHKALDIAREIKDSYKIAMSCLDIGDIHLQEKHYEKSLKAFIMARKTIENTISTDSREKIDRRFKKVINEIGEQNFKQIIEKLKKKHE